MSFRIRTNVASINAQRHLNKTSNAIKESSTRLASGSRINKAGDDAAGLAISENLRADIRSMEQAKRNASDGVSLAQVAEGGLVETANMLTRLRELAIQASSDTVGMRERDYLDKEFLQLKAEINRIAASTEFNGTYLLTGENGPPSEVGDFSNSFPLEVQVSKDYFPDADSVDSDNPINLIKMDLSEINAFTHGDGSLELGEGEDGARVDSKGNAQSSIADIDAAIDRVNSHRATIGALQNRFESAIANLGTRVQALSEAKSRISDTDFAMETAKFTQESILQQAGTSVLASANQMPQVALALLG